MLSKDGNTRNMLKRLSSALFRQRRLSSTPLSSFQLNWAALASHSSSVSFKRRDSVTQQCRRLVRCMCWQSTRSFSVEQHVCREGKYLVMMKTKKNLHHHWNYRSSPWYTIHAPNAISFRRPCASNHSAHITRLTPAQGLPPMSPFSPSFTHLSIRFSFQTKAKTRQQDTPL